MKVTRRIKRMGVFGCCLFLAAHASAFAEQPPSEAIVPVEHASFHQLVFADDDIADPALRARFDKTIEAFLSLAEAAKHYPCIKRAWVEFLGEPPGEAADRVDPVSS